MRLINAILLLLLFSFTEAQTKFQKDFATYWEIVNKNFGYFDIQKTDWQKVNTIYQPVADTITTTPGFIRLLETVNHELYNGHISLNTNLPSSNRLIPTGADLWVEFKNRQFIISAVRTGFNAEACGLKPGMQILRFNNEPIDSAVMRYLPRSVSGYDARMYEYAANMLLAGTHDIKRMITVALGNGERTFFPDRISNKTTQGYTNVLDYRIIAPGIGYILINNSLGNSDLIAIFDIALDSLWNTNGLIIDLRETPSGGNTIVARAIMSRFIEKEMPYQKHSLPAEETKFGVKRSWVEWVSPRGRIYKKPLIILVNRWTGSMGEGLAIGFHGMKRARIVGDKMAGLLGAIYSYTLPETGIGFSLPVEKLFHVNGMSREDFMPQIIEKDNKKALAKAISLLSTRLK